MTEILTPQTPERAVEMNEQQLFALGELCVAAAERTDLVDVSAEHQQVLDNPNTVGGGLFVGGEVPMSSEHAYRQVGGSAIEDLAASGIVRNGATAQGEKHPRWGDRVFWNAGEEGKKVTTGGRFIIEAPLEAVNSGWVTADKVTGVYAKTPDGTVKNILKQPS